MKISFLWHPHFIDTLYDVASRALYLDFTVQSVILRTYLRVPDSKSYESLGEILWETAGAGATAASLRTAIAKVYINPEIVIFIIIFYDFFLDFLIEL